MLSALSEALQALGSWPGSLWLQNSGVAYLCVNAAHILGVGLLVGSIVPLDLRLMGVWGRNAPLAVLVPFLSRAAAVGLTLALITGVWLFSVRPIEYAGNSAFQYKLGLIGLAMLNVGWQHASHELQNSLQNRTAASGVRLRAGTSFVLWMAVLLAGRWIGFL